MKENGWNTYPGVHTDGFRAATEDAVAKYEDEHGVPERPMTFKVVEMYVTVHNPIHDYRIVLSPTG
jgi:hypothetical protein